MLNPFLNAVEVTSSEHDLFDSMLVESIQLVGVDLTYFILHESKLNELNEAEIHELERKFTIEAEIIDVSGFSGDSDLLNGFGIYPADRATFKLAVSRFNAQGLKFGLKAPSEGDVVYDPVGRRLWEIRRVNTDDKYYIAGKHYCWILECSLYQPKHDEVFDPSDFIFKETLDQVNLPQIDQSNTIVQGAEQSTVEKPSSFNVDNPFGE